MNANIPVHADVSSYALNTVMLLYPSSWCIWFAKETGALRRIPRLSQCMWNRWRERECLDSSYLRLICIYGAKEGVRL